MDNCFSINISYLRNKFQLTQNELAEAITITRDALSAIENNKNKKIEISVLQEFSKYFNISIDDLINKNLQELDKKSNAEEYYIKDTQQQATATNNVVDVNEKTLKIYQELVDTKDETIKAKEELVVELKQTIKILKVLLNQNGVGGM